MCVQNGMLTICGEARRFAAAHPIGLPKTLTGPKSGHRRLTFAGSGKRGERRLSRIRVPRRSGSRIVSPPILSQNCYDKFTRTGISVIDLQRRPEEQRAASRCRRRSKPSRPGAGSLSVCTDRIRPGGMSGDAHDSAYACPGSSGVDVRPACLVRPGAPDGKVSNEGETGNDCRPPARIGHA